MTEQTRVSVEIDWERVPEGAHEATVTVTGAGNRFDVPLRVLNDGRRARHGRAASSRPTGMSR